MVINSSNCRGIIVLLSLYSKNLLDWKFDWNWFVFVTLSEAQMCSCCTNVTAFLSSCGKTTSGLVHVEAGSSSAEPLPSWLCLEGEACSDAVLVFNMSPWWLFLCLGYWPILALRGSLCPFGKFKGIGWGKEYQKCIIKQIGFSASVKA